MVVQQTKPLSARRSGFTLLEMVAAMVLMTILFAALTSLLRSFAKQGRALDRLAVASPSTISLSDVLRRDITNARFMRSDQRSLVLAGNLARGWQTRELNGLRAEVIYEIELIAGESWLTRKEVHLDSVSAARARKEPMWRGVTGLQLVAVVEAGQVETEEELPAGMSPIPTRVHLLVERDGASPLLELSIVHHWEDS